VLTPQQYKQMMEEVFGRDKRNFEVVDLMVVADYYKKFFEGCLDKKFGRYAKEETTQLCWRMESVPVNRNYPLGVKTMYRAYSTEVAFEIVPTADNEVNVTCFYLEHYLLLIVV
jgi:hypothetical protein